MNQTNTAQPSVDEARLLPHFRLEQQQARVLEAEVTRAHSEGVAPTKPSPASLAEPGDLRGIPVIARGVGGTSPHTQPENETVHRYGEWKAA